MTEEVLPRKNDAVVLDTDVRVYFPDSESVNKALRCLIPFTGPTAGAARNTVRLVRGGKLDG